MRTLFTAACFMFCATATASACPDMRSAAFKAAESAYSTNLMVVGVAALVFAMLISRFFWLPVVAIALSFVNAPLSAVCNSSLSNLQTTHNLHYQIVAGAITIAIAIWLTPILRSKMKPVA